MEAVFLWHDYLWLSTSALLTVHCKGREDQFQSLAFSAGYLNLKINTQVFKLTLLPPLDAFDCSAGYEVIFSLEVAKTAQ